jgi:putative methylase
MITEYKLATILSKLEEHPNPKYTLEQYSITPSIAARVLFLAKNDFKNRIVYDLGCGTGRLAIGAALLGAKISFGIDFDIDALEIAEKNSKYVEEVTGIPITKICRWINLDVMKLNTKADVVIQFPPFETGDLFFKKALELSNIVYSIHKSSEAMEIRLKELCKEYKFRLIGIKKFEYRIPWKEGKKIGFEIMLVVAKS